MARPTTNTPWASDYVTQAVVKENGDAGVAENKTQPPTAIQTDGILYQEPLANNWFNWKMNELTQWIAHLSGETSYTGFTPVTEYLLSDYTEGGVAIDFEVSVSTATALTIGPSGSGADVLWTALNILPLDATHVNLNLSYTSGVQSGGTSGETLELRVEMYPVGYTPINDKAVVLVGDSRVANPAVAHTFSQANTAVVPLNSTNSFEVNWDRDILAGATTTMLVNVMGWKE